MGHVCVGMGKTVKMSFERKNLAGNWQMDMILIILKKKKNDPRAIFNNIQTYSRFQVSVYRTIGPLVSVFLIRQAIVGVHSNYKYLN